ncbi:hypothetical protein uan_038 [Pseudomonas phage UAntarctica]|nr:hypothetical protein uan_038 [Pseudomonas phage UAntarctica]
MSTFCKYVNTHPHSMQVTLEKGEWVAMTYKSTLRAGNENGREFFNIMQGLPSVIISPVAGHKLKLGLSHGRTDPSEDMEEFGTDYEGEPLTAEIVHFTDAAIMLINTGEDGVTPVVTTISYFADMILHEGVYYGDPSVEAV